MTLPQQFRHVPVALGIAIVALALSLLAGCTGSTTTADNQPDRSIYLTVVLNSTANTVRAIVDEYGPLPVEATNALTATRDYAEGICSVMAQDMTYEQRLVALHDGLRESRETLDAAYNALLQSAASPAVRIAARSAIDTTRDVFDLAIAIETDPTWFAVPCARLQRIPRIVTA